MLQDVAARGADDRFMSNPLARSYRSCRRWTAVEGRAALTALAASGLSAAAFGEREGLDPQRLYAWERKLGVAKARVQRAEFVEVRRAVTERIEVVLRSGVVVRVAETVDAEALRRIVEALERTSPC